VAGGLAAVVAYVASAAFVIGADPWDPLADWGWGILLASSVAIGLAGGRWPMLLAPLALVPLAPLNRMTEPHLFISSGVYWAAGMSAALVAVGIGLRVLVRRYGERGDRRAACTGVGLICLASALTGWGIYLDHRVVDREPSDPLLIDDRSGTYRGIAPGEPTGRVRRLLGRPSPDSGAYNPYPLQVDRGDLSGVHALPAGNTWRYPTLVVFAAEDRVRAYLTTDPSAQTAAGVGIGDSLAIATRAYPNLDCSGVIGGSDAVNPYSLKCHGWLAGGASISFGGDPIDNILISKDDPPSAGELPIS